MKRLINKISNFILISFSLLIIIFSLLVYNKLNDLSPIKLPELKNIPTTSYIYNDKDILVKEINDNFNYYVTYEDLSDDFINALISIEDNNFFNHEGYDIKRIFSSLINNIKSQKIVQGASTLTQQLVKNITLDNSKNINRKIKEIYLANKLEQDYSKEEIITYYSNIISFEGTKYGVNYAAYRFFNKEIKDVNLAEAALLAGLVKSPTIYNPYTHEDNAFNRKNLVLKTMLNNNYISNEEYEAASKLKISDMLKQKEKKDTNYPYQAYIDVVYKDINKYYKIDPYTTPIKVHTYLNTELQLVIDNIQKNNDKTIIFNDELLNIGGAVIDNKNGSIIGIIGGRNYNGEKLYNHALDLFAQPASTIKPLLSYALAYEYLDYGSAHPLIDEPSFYPNTNIQINNVDNKYLGEILIEDALGYSRNTTAVNTLKEVINKVGRDKVTNYLSKINLLDCKPDEFVYSYALGGFKHGVNPINLASAYSMLANYGLYQEPTTIKYIELLNSNEKLYPNTRKEQILSKESSFLINYNLRNIVNKNYWNIALCKPRNIEIGAKTGTSNFDKSFKEQMGYPTNASKDIWISGFSKDYSITIWTGFDKYLKNEKTYFLNGNNNKLAKLIFKRLMEEIADPSITFHVPSSITERTIVKGLYPYKLATNEINSKGTIKSYFKKSATPTSFYEVAPLPILDNLEYIYYNDSLHVYFPNYTYEETKNLYKRENVEGRITYNIELNFNDEIKTFSSLEPIVEVPYYPFLKYKISGYLSYEYATNYKSNYFTFEVL